MRIVHRNWPVLIKGVKILAMSATLAQEINNVLSLIHFHLEQLHVYVQMVWFSLTVEAVNRLRSDLNALLMMTVLTLKSVTKAVA